MIFLNRILFVSLLGSSSILPTQRISLNKLVGPWQSNELGIPITMVFFEDNSFEYIFIIDEESEPEILIGQYELQGIELTISFEHGAKSTYEIVELDKQSLILRYNETLIHYFKSQ